MTELLLIIGLLISMWVPTLVHKPSTELYDRLVMTERWSRGIKREMERLDAELERLMRGNPDITN